jgi:hypothetical protein
MTSNLGIKLKTYCAKIQLCFVRAGQVNFFLTSDVGRDSSVGIATRYGLEGPGIISRWGRDFPHPFTPALRLTQFPVQWVPGLFLEGKAAGVWR